MDNKKTVNIVLFNYLFLYFGDIRKIITKNVTETPAPFFFYPFFIHFFL